MGHGFVNQFRLLPSRHFGPFFLTQFLGAFNDNLFKNALVILIAYQGLSAWKLDSQQLVALSSGIFILPFFLFSATAGQLSDKYAKSRLMRYVKFAEIPIMGLAAYGLVTQDLGLLMGVLFLMGTQSSLFGPAKYSVLPELLQKDDLVGGNAFVETGTFVGILLGTITAGVLMLIQGHGTWILAGAIFFVALSGWLTSLFIPQTPRAAPDLRVNINPVTPTLQTFRTARRQRPVFLAILGISWFWFLGASLLAMLPNYCRDVLHGSEAVVTLLLTVFCLGMVTGSLLCERLSDRKLELGLVPFGSIGISLFLLDLFLVGDPYAVTGASGTLLGLGAFLSAPAGLRVVADIALLAVFSGFFTVPLYTMIQQRSEPGVRARIIAANNILNALFMVISSLLLVRLFSQGMSHAYIFCVLAVSNAAVALFIYTLVPEFLLRFTAWILASLMYRVQVTGRENIPEDGPAVLVCNHVSFIDWLIIASACKRPARFVMYHGYFNMPVVGFLFRDAKVIPIAPAHEDQGTLDAAFDRIAAELEAGEIVCIFPEGKLSRDGKLNTFRSGIERIIERTPVPVVPMALVGMWGSIFSREGSASLARPFRRFWSRISLRIAPPVPAAKVSAQGLAVQVAHLGEWEVPRPD